MKTIITKPIKEWNLLDFGIATVFGLAMIPVGFLIVNKSFGIGAIKDEDDEEVMTEEE